MPRRKLGIPLAATALLLCPACDLPFGIGDAWLEGDWVYLATNLSGGGMACDIHDLTLKFDQEGGSLSGSASTGTVECRGPGATESETLAAAPITGGTVDGDRVRFNLGTEDFRHTGTIHDRSMSGTAVWRRNLGDSLGVVLLTGKFAASRPPQ